MRVSAKAGIFGHGYVKGQSIPSLPQSSNPALPNVIRFAPPTMGPRTLPIAAAALRGVRARFASIAVLALFAACQSVPHSPPSVVMASGTGVVGSGSGAAIAAAEKAAREYAPADVAFMQGMIPHHAQAVIIAHWAATHGARADVKILCERIAVAQSDEIHLMRAWLAARNQTVPDSTSTRHMMKMAGMADMDGGLMPGMLSDEQMKALDAARGSKFDRLFLVGMIGHHKGAIAMVRELFSHGDAGHDDTVFRFANDVEADQSAELNKMLIMLKTVPE
jgi:uncharacterized protein (DUF305 family)